MDELKKLATQAKRRLATGYFGCEKQQKRCSNYITFVKSQNMPAPAHDYVNFINRVRDILENNENVDNPLGLLIDWQEYNKLGYVERQKYIFNLAERYQNAVAVINQR